MNDSSKKLDRVGSSLVLLVVALVFAPSLFGDYVWDDTSLIVLNANIRDPASVFELVSTPFWAQFQNDGVPMSPLYSWLHRPLIKLVYHYGLRLGDESPFAFHLLLLALHVGCAFQVFELVRTWLGDRTVASTVSAFLLAILFAIHPSRAENVAWISGITDVAMTFFLLLGLRLLRGEPSAGRLIGGGLAVALAGWSKETAILVPALVLAQGTALGSSRRAILRSTAASLVGALMVLVTFVLAVSPSADKTSLTSHEGIVLRVLATLGWFVARIVWPLPATLYPGAFIRGAHGIMPTPAWVLILGASALLGGLGLFVWDAKRHRPPRMLLPLGLFFVPLVPVLNLIPRSTTGYTADRFLYLPMVGLLLLGARPVAKLFADGSRSRPLALLLSGVVVLACASETLASTARFSDDITLFEHEVAVQPDFSQATANLIDGLRQLRRFPEARDYAVGALARAHARHDIEGEIAFALEYLRINAQLWPEFDEAALRRVRDAYEGVESRHTLAISDGRLRFSRSLDSAAVAAITGDAGRFALPRAVVALRLGDLETAHGLLESLVRLAPRMPMAWELLAICRARRGHYPLALRAIEQGMHLLGRNPGLMRARDMIVNARRISERDLPEPALRAIRDANLQLMLGGPGAARKLLNPVLDAHPEMLEAIVLLAQVEEADGLPQRAMTVLDAGLARLPGNELLLAVRRQLVERMTHNGTG